MPHDTPPICPRCGYDLSGTAAAFTEQCPMQGTCSECGHEFRWTEVLSPHLTTLPGFIEHTRTLRDFIHAAVTTLFWLIRPRVFWSRLTLDHRINFSRPIIAAFALHTAFQLLQACASYAIFIIYLAVNHRALTDAPSFFDQAMWPLVHTAAPGTPAQFWGLTFPIADRWPYYVALLAFALTWPLGLLTLFATRWVTTLRPAHVLRAANYGVLALLAPTLFMYFTRIAQAADGLCQILFPPLHSYQQNPSSLVISNQFLFVATFIWVALWWYHAINTGWHVKHGRRLWWILLTVSTFTSLGLFTFLRPSSVEDFLNRVGLH